MTRYDGGFPDNGNVDISLEKLSTDFLLNTKGAN